MNKIDFSELLANEKKKNKIVRPKKMRIYDKKGIKLIFKEIDSTIQIKYDSLDLYFVQTTLNKMKNKIRFPMDEKIQNQIKKDVLSINGTNIDNYLSDDSYSSFIKERTTNICLAIQGYLRIISVERYKKYFKSIRWSVGAKYTVNSYSSYLIYRRIFFNESLCNSCYKLFRQEVLVSHEKKCKEKKSVKNIKLEESQRKNKEKIICEYCNNSMKRKNLKKHLKKKCKRYKAFLNKKPKKVEDIDMSEMKDFNRLEQLYITLFLDESKLSIVEYQKRKNDIKRLEIYFSEDEKLEIKEKVERKARKKFKSPKLDIAVSSKENNLITCKYCEVLLNKKNYERHLKKCPKNKNLILEKKSNRKKNQNLSPKKNFGKKIAQLKR